MDLMVLLASTYVSTEVQEGPFCGVLVFEIVSYVATMTFKLKWPPHVAQVSENVNFIPRACLSLVLIFLG